GRYGILGFEAALDVRRAGLVPSIGPLPWVSIDAPNLALPIHHALQHFRRERLDAAARRLLEAIDLQPDSPVSYRDLAGVREQQGDYTNAITLLDEALKRSAGCTPKILAELYGK